jgi:predicted nucleotidyltransferase
VLDELIARARADENVIGVIHSGSRGRDAYVTETSDWDAFVIVHEERGDYESLRGSGLELSEVTLAVLAAPPDWARPAFLSLTPQLDKTGEVAEALRAATTVDPATAGRPLDAYVNSYYRSAKNARVGLDLASLLDAQESIPRYLEFVFAVHGRVRPYNKWLEWELREHPLSVELDLARLERIGRTGALAEQQALFRETEALAREHGHGETIDGWAPDIGWLRGDPA